MAGDKTWELRNEPATQRGRIYITVATRKRDTARAGAEAARLTPAGRRYIIGSVELVGSHVIDGRAFDDGQSRHRFEEACEEGETRYEAALRMAGGRRAQLHAWELREPRWYEWPVPFKATAAVKWPTMQPPAGATWGEVQRAARGEGGLAAGRRRHGRERAQQAEEAAAAGRMRRRTGVNDASERPRRATVQRVDYNQTAGRRREPAQGQKRQRSPGAARAYMDRAATVARSGGRLRPEHVRISPLTVERMVEGRYDWQDGALTQRRRRVMTDDGRAEDPG